MHHVATQGLIDQRIMNFSLQETEEGGFEVRNPKPNIAQIEVFFFNYGVFLSMVAYSDANIVL